MRIPGIQSRSPIGLDIGSRWIKAVQLTTGRLTSSLPRVVAATVFPRLHPDKPIDNTEITRISDVLFRQGFTGNQFVVAAVDNQLLTSTLELPPLDSNAPRNQIAISEIARNHGCDASSIEVSEWNLASGNEESTTPHQGDASRPARPGTVSSQTREHAAMAVACPHECANTLLDKLEDSNLDILAIDVGWLASVRACQPMLQASNEVVSAILDIGWQCSRLVAVRNGVVVYERTLSEVGLENIWSRIQTQFNLDDQVMEFFLQNVGMESVVKRSALASDTDSTHENQDAIVEDIEVSATDEPQVTTRQKIDVQDQFAAFAQPRRIMDSYVDALATELSRSVSYLYQQYHGADFDKVLLTGGGAAIPGIQEQLCSVIEVNLQVADLQTLAICQKEIPAQAQSSMLTGALGLALHSQKG
jgi:Tfp pilus assembly PilM family ATPase